MAKHLGQDFNEHLHEVLKNDDIAVFYHIKEALSDPSDTEYLFSAINDVAIARGKSNLAGNASITRAHLHNILNGKSTPSLEVVMKILNALGLRLSVERIHKHHNPTPASALDCAEYLRKELSKSETTMKLEKLLYFAQAQSLIDYGTALFHEAIRAYPAGPVVYEVFKKHQGIRRIDCAPIFGDENQLSIEQKNILDIVLTKYGKVSAEILSQLTHEQDPWKNARIGLGDKEKTTREISIESIKDYFSKIPNYMEIDEDNLLMDVD